MTRPEWLALSPHIKKDLGSTTGSSQGHFCLLSLHVLPMSVWLYFPGTRISSQSSKTCMFGQIGDSKLFQGVRMTGVCSPH